MNFLRRFFEREKSVEAVPENTIRTTRTGDLIRISDAEKDRELLVQQVILLYSMQAPNQYRKIVRLECFSAEGQAVLEWFEDNDELSVHLMRTRMPLSVSETGLDFTSLDHVSSESPVKLRHGDQDYEHSLTQVMHYLNLDDISDIKRLEHLEPNLPQICRWRFDCVGKPEKFLVVSGSTPSLGVEIGKQINADAIFVHRKNSSDIPRPLGPMIVGQRNEDSSCKSGR